MKNGLRLLFAGWLLVVFSLPLLAQNRITVKGKVSDENGAPIPFASVTIKGSGGGYRPMPKGFTQSMFRKGQLSG
jgi:hypothetical protein